MRTVCLWALLLAGAAEADSLYTAQSPFASLFSDRKAVCVGDTLNILIVETAQASQNMADQTAAKSNATMGPGVGLLDFIPVIGYSGDIAAQSGGSTSRSASFSARIAVTVTGVTPAGNLLVEGSRQVRVHKDYQDIKLSGEVRRQDISADNTVPSYRVANACISYTGSNPLRPGNKVGIITRALHWLF